MIDGPGWRELAAFPPGGGGTRLSKKQEDTAMPNVTLKDLKQVWAEGDHPPFEKYAPVEAVYLTAVKLSRNNLEGVAFFMLQNGRGAVFIPEGRDSFCWNDDEFTLGDWVVLDWEDQGGVRWAAFRHATNDEVRRYGLDAHV